MIEESLAESSTRNQPTAPSISVPVASEIRQLRVALEESTRRQTETQALGVYLSAQQSRLLQASAKLESARRDVEALTTHSRDIAAKLAESQERLHIGTAEQREHYRASVNALQLQLGGRL